MFLGDVKNSEKENTKNIKNPIKGENIETEIKVSLEDAFYGLEKRYHLEQLKEK